jgi:MFS superfamily sulfate permease-like transporter
MVGFFYLLVAVCQLDFFAAFLSHAITSGFSSGAAFIIMLTQLKYFFGVKTKATSTGRDIVVELIKNVSDTKWEEALMFSLFVLLLVFMKFLASRFHRLRWLRSLGPMTVCIVSISAVVIGGLEDKIKIVKHVPRGVHLSCALDQFDCHLCMHMF